MRENSRNPETSGNPAFPTSRPIADIVEQIIREGHGRTAEQRQVRTEWRPEDLATKAGFDRTTLTNLRNGKRCRENTLRKLVKVAFGAETSDHPLAAELWAAHRASTARPDPGSDRAHDIDSTAVHVVQLDDRTPFAEGRFYIPLPGQRGGNANQIPIHLRLVFPGLAKVTTKLGAVVFAITSARLSVGASAGHVVNQNSDFETGWTGEWTSVRVVPATRGEVAWQITSNDLARPLSGNVLVRQGEDPHVRLFDVEIDEPTIKVRIHGRVTFDVDGVGVDLHRSSLKKPLPAAKQAIEVMQAKIAARVVNACGDGSVEFEEVEP